MWLTQLFIAVQYALAMGLKVAALDIGAQQLEIAEELGATAVFNSADSDLAAKVREKTSGGVHAASVFSGSVKAYQAGVSVLRLGGTLVVVGVVSLGHI